MTTRSATPPDTASRVWTALHESVTGQDRRACPPRRPRSRAREGRAADQARRRSDDPARDRTRRRSRPTSRDGRRRQARSARPGPRRPRTLGTEFVHFFLFEQDVEVTLIDAGLSGYRDTLEPALSVFDPDSATPASPSAQA